jgi:hypothetical protein
MDNNFVARLWNNALGIPVKYSVTNLKTMMRNNLLALITLVSLFFGACKDNTTPGGGTPNVSNARASMKVMLTDDPADYDQVNIDVQSVEINTDSGGWMTLNTFSGMYDLLDLTNGIDTLIANDSLPVGMITQIRLNLGSNNTIMVDSVIYPLEIPSGNTSGLKINIHQNLVAGGSYTLLVDFDAGHSIVEQGNGVYKLKPVLHAQLVSNVITDGTVTGVIMPPGSNAFVSATNASDSTSTYIDTTTGQYSLQNLTPGSYTIWVNTNAPYNDTTFTFNVTAGPNAIDTIWVQ